MNSHEFIADDTGVEIMELATARAFALQAIDDIREEAVEDGTSWRGWRLDVVDPSGNVLLSIPLELALH